MNEIGMNLVRITLHVLFAIMLYFLLVKFVENNVNEFFILVTFIYLMVGISLSIMSTGQLIITFGKKLVIKNE